MPAKGGDGLVAEVGAVKAEPVHAVRGDLYPGQLQEAVREAVLEDRQIRALFVANLEVEAEAQGPAVPEGADRAGISLGWPEGVLGGSPGVDEVAAPGDGRQVAARPACNGGAVRGDRRGPGATRGWRVGLPQLRDVDEPVLGPTGRIHDPGEEGHDLWQGRGRERQLRVVDPGLGLQGRRAQGPTCLDRRVAGHVEAEPGAGVGDREGGTARRRTRTFEQGVYAVAALQDLVPDGAGLPLMGAWQLGRRSLCGDRVAGALGCHGVSGPAACVCRRRVDLAGLRGEKQQEEEGERAPGQVRDNTAKTPTRRVHGALRGRPTGDGFAVERTDEAGGSAKNEPREGSSVASPSARDRLHLEGAFIRSLRQASQVFRLVDRPTPGAFPGLRPVASCRFRPHSRRRDRVGFTPTSLKKPCRDFYRRRRRRSTVQSLPGRRRVLPSTGAAFG